MWRKGKKYDDAGEKGKEGGWGGVKERPGCSVRMYL